jgi:hypothetical protein
MKRSRFLRWLVALPIVAVPLVRWAVPLLDKRRAAAWERDIRSLESEYTNDLKAMARALLPSSVGSAEADALAPRFIRWLALQRTNAELSHLSGRLRMGDPFGVRPGTRRAVITGANYVRQIEQLRSQAHPRRLAQLDRIEMTLLLTTALQVSGARDIPAGPVGRNILLDLLSFFYRSPRAVDLFHGRRIGAVSCRGLDGIARAPALLPLPSKA